MIRQIRNYPKIVNCFLCQWPLYSTNQNSKKIERDIVSLNLEQTKNVKSHFTEIRVLYVLSTTSQIFDTSMSDDVLVCHVYRPNYNRNSY